MKKTFCSLTLFAATAAVCLSQTNVLKLTRHIELRGVRGRFDHMAADVAGHRLFVAALENNTLEILDLKSGKPLDSIRGLHKPTGVAFLPDLNRLCIANGDDATCKFYDGKTLVFINAVENLDDADNLRYDAKTKLLYVGFGGGELAIVDVAKAKRLAVVPLKAHPESFILETQGPRVFVNLPERKQIAVVDREKKNIIAIWAAEKFDGNFPMAFDEKNQRLFIGCRKPARLHVLDTKTGNVITEDPISGDIDDLFFDAANKRLYASCGAGYIDVITQIDADHYKTLGKIPTGKMARTSLLIPDLKLFCVAVPAHPAHEAEIQVFEVR